MGYKILHYHIAILSKASLKQLYNLVYQMRDKEK